MTGRTVLFLNGPNANLYGLDAKARTAPKAFRRSRRAAARTPRASVLALDFRQSNHEGELIDWIQAARGRMPTG